jgi:hypothetical protein
MVAWTFEAIKMKAKLTAIIEAIKMKAKLTAIIEAATEGGYWAICPEIAGANGQGETIAETKLLSI